jgi:hypothetical protein
MKIELENPIPEHTIQTINQIVEIVRMDLDLKETYRLVKLIKTSLEIGSGSSHIWVADPKTTRRVLLITE